MRNGVVALGLLFLATSYIIGNAFYQKKQFYPTVVFLTKHKPFFAVILTQCITIILLTAKTICWLFFGTLMRDELDNLLSRSWYTFFDMCLVFAFFQDELNTKFMFLFSCILFMKVFHWLLEGRIDHMERTPVITISFHIKMFVFITFLLFTDIFHILYFYWGTSTNQLVSLAVGAEYYILLFDLISTMLRYLLQIINSLHNTPWDRKAMYLLYVDIFIGLLRLAFYMEFAPILWSHHPFPLFIIRPIYLNFRFLKKAIRDLLMSRRAIRMMNTEFPDVTITELAQSSDTVCIICREDMHQHQPSSNERLPPPEITPGTIKRLPCSHIFHASCLRTWFQRQQTCPTCRANVLRQMGRRQAPGAAAAPEARAPAHVVHIGVVNDQHQNNSGPTASAVNSNQAQAAAASPASFPPSMFPFVPSNIPFHPLGSGPIGSATPPPFMMPPILIPGNVFMLGSNTPMPVPPGDLTNPPTAEEEAQLRTNIAARLQALRQIQTLWDAAIIQMNSYLAASATISQQNDKSANLTPTPKTERNSANNSDTSSNLASEQQNLREPVTEVKTILEVDENNELALIRKRRLEKLDAKGPTSRKDSSTEQS